jgi:hypothetical protein
MNVPRDAFPTKVLAIQFGGAEVDVGNATYQLAIQFLGERI